MPTKTVMDQKKSAFPSIVVVLSAASLSVGLWSGFARADYYDRIVRFDCDPGSKVVHMSLRMTYEGSRLGRYDRFFDDLAKSPAGLTCRLSPRTLVVVRALSNPQATNDDNLQVLVNGNEVTSLSFDPSAENEATISETPKGTVQVDQ